MPNVFSVHQRTCLISHTPAYVGAIRRSVTRPLKAVVLLFLTFCSLLLPFWESAIVLFCCTLLYVHSSITIILMGKRELVALLNLSSWCLVMIEWLFLAVPWGCLRFVIVVFPDHTHLQCLLSSLIARRWVGFQTL